MSPITESPSLSFASASSLALASRALASLRSFFRLASAFLFSRHSCVWETRWPASTGFLQCLQTGLSPDFVAPLRARELGVGLRVVPPVLVPVFSLY